MSLSNRSGYLRRAFVMVTTCHPSRMKASLRSTSRITWPSSKWVPSLSYSASVCDSGQQKSGRITDRPTMRAASLDKDTLLLSSGMGNSYPPIPDGRQRSTKQVVSLGDRDPARTHLSFHDAPDVLDGQQRFPRVVSHGQIAASKVPGRAGACCQLPHHGVPPVEGYVLRALHRGGLVARHGCARGAQDGPWRGRGYWARSS